ncbi:MAG: tetratricopeptide repeat protein [Pirellulales bacterium]
MNSCAWRFARSVLVAVSAGLLLMTTHARCLGALADTTCRSADEQRDRLIAEVEKLRSLGRYPAAIDAANQLLALEKIQGPENRLPVLKALGVLEELQIDNDDMLAAISVIDQRIAQLREIPNVDAGAIAEAQDQQAELRYFRKQSTDFRRRWRQAFVQESELTSLYKQGRLSEAIALASEFVDICREIYPEDHFPDGHRQLATSLHNLGYMLRERADFAAARPYIEQAWKMRQRLFPTNRFPQGHPHLSTSLNVMGQLGMPRS